LSRIGSEISRLRREKGYTQKQLAKLLGVSEGYIDEVESGKRVLKDSLIARAYRILGQSADVAGGYEDGGNEKPPVSAKATAKAPPAPVQQVWNDALDAILKSVPVYDYKMEETLGKRQLPVVSSKIEGHPRDKVFYLRIQDNDLSGLRICKGDLALACMTQEAEKDAFCLVEHEGRRMLRLIKKLEGNKLLLVSNSGNLATEMADMKAVKILARLIRLEIEL
jgi:transcriptional regulator with XRE-family HTH domain